jgi:hypothetical protein
VTYFCTVCAARWAYLEIRYVARCKACGAGLTSTPPAEALTICGPVGGDGAASRGHWGRRARSQRAASARRGVFVG